MDAGNGRVLDSREGTVSVGLGTMRTEGLGSYFMAPFLMVSGSFIDAITRPVFAPRTSFWVRRLTMSWMLFKKVEGMEEVLGRSSLVVLVDENS